MDERPRETLSAAQVDALLTEAGLMAPRIYEALIDAKLERSRLNVMAIVMVAVDEMRELGVSKDELIALVKALYDCSSSVPVERVGVS